MQRRVVCVRNLVCENFVCENLLASNWQQVSSHCGKKKKRKWKEKNSMLLHYWDYITLIINQLLGQVNQRRKSNSMLYIFPVCEQTCAPATQSVSCVASLSILFQGWAHLFHLTTFLTRTLGHPSSPFYFRHCTGCHLEKWSLLFCCNTIWGSCAASVQWSHTSCLPPSI